MQTTAALEIHIVVGKKTLTYHDPIEFEKRLRNELADDFKKPVGTIHIEFIQKDDSYVAVNGFSDNPEAAEIKAILKNTAFSMAAAAGEFDDEDSDLREADRHKASELMRSHGFVPDEQEGGWYKDNQSCWIEANLEELDQYMKMDYYSRDTGMLKFSASIAVNDCDDETAEKVFAVFEI